MHRIDIYKELFTYKIKRRKKVLILAIDNIEPSISPNINIIINKYVKLDFFNIGTNSLRELPGNLHNYDIVICDDILSFSGSMPSNIPILKTLLTNNGGILMFITPLEIKKDISYSIKNFFGIDTGFRHIDDMFDMLRSNELKIIDNYNVCTVCNYFYYTNIFCISCLSW